jgi:hypothetical protein
MRYKHWTTKELDLLKTMHVGRLPPYKELMSALPRHSEDSIRQAAIAHKLRRKNRDWIKIAKQYSIERGDKALVRA